MPASRRRGLRPGSVVRAVGRLALLVGLGFGAGLVIGVVSEEPELLAGHLRGEGQSIELTAPIALTAPIELTAPSEDVSRPGAGEPVSEAAGNMAARDTRPESPGPSNPSSPRAPQGRDRALPPVAAAPRAVVDVKSADVPEAAGDHEWAIQVGAFGEEAAAERLRKGLVEKGYPAKLVPATSDQRWRVRVQPIRGRETAAEMADRLKRVERLPTWVIPMEAR